MPPVTVTFAPNAPQPQQIQCSPDTVQVPYGPGQTVTWNLQGPPGAVFAANGIYFKSDSPGILTRVTDTQYSLADDNTNKSGQAVDYAYGINITYNQQTYNKDPEVENESGSGPMKLTHTSA